MWLWQDQFDDIKPGQLEEMDKEIKAKTEEQRALASETQALESSAWQQRTCG